METPRENTTSIPCYECQAGRLKRTRKVYYTWMGSELITVPDFPAWSCDFCGRTEYDEEALNNLSVMLSSVNSAGRKTKRNIKTGPVLNQKSNSLGRSEK